MILAQPHKQVFSCIIKSCAEKILTGVDEIHKIYNQLGVDGAYERYITHHDKFHPELEALTFENFYRLHIENKWNGITRCC